MSLWRSFRVSKGSAMKGIKAEVVASRNVAVLYSSAGVALQHTIKVAWVTIALFAGGVKLAEDFTRC